jgi:hypothetical protein
VLLLGHPSSSIWFKSLLQGGPLFRGQARLIDVIGDGTSYEMFHEDAKSVAADIDPLNRRV